MSDTAHTYNGFDPFGAGSPGSGLMEVLDKAIWEAEVFADKGGGAVVRQIQCGRSVYVGLLGLISKQARESREYAGYYIKPSEYLDAQSLSVYADDGSMKCKAITVEPKEGTRF